MTTPQDGGSPEGGTAAILRALGTLMAALGGDDRRPAERPALEYAAPLPAARPAAPRAEAPPSLAPPPPPVFSPALPSSGGVPDAELLLADARQRAQRILDESIERASVLMTPAAREDGSNEGIETVRRSVSQLLASMHDVQRRLERIEGLLEMRSAAAPPVMPSPQAAQPPPMPPPPTPPPVEEDRARASLSVVTPNPPAALSPAAPAGMPASAVPPAARVATQRAFAPPPEPVASPSPPPAPEPLAPPAPPPVAPPAARVPSPPPPAPEPVAPPAPPAPPAAPAARIAPPEPEAPVAEEEPVRAEPVQLPQQGSASSLVATFAPADGSVLLRATPVPGFQGLMRLQDALGRLSGVRHATVEAYAQGEARLRLDLATEVDSDQIAAGLRLHLGQEAEVTEASETDRTILIKFA